MQLLYRGPRRDVGACHVLLCAVITCSSPFSARELLQNDWLIVGIAINHPGAGRKGGEKIKRSMTDARSGDTDQSKPPSIVGYSANIGKNEFEFVGGESLLRY